MYGSALADLGGLLDVFYGNDVEWMVEASLQISA